MAPVTVFSRSATLVSADAWEESQEPMFFSATERSDIVITCVIDADLRGRTRHSRPMVLRSRKSCACNLYNSFVVRRKEGNSRDDKGQGDNPNSPTLDS